MTPGMQLHYAALAAGRELVWIDDVPHATTAAGVVAPWNPRQSEGDAHRLAVHLDIGIKHMPGARRTFISRFPYAVSLSWDDYGDDKYGATLDGIVQVAAMMGRAQAGGLVPG